MKNYTVQLISLIFGLLCSLTSCSPDQSMDISPDRIDHHSLSNFHDVVTKHIHLELKVDFDQKVLKGFARLTIDQLHLKTSELILDTRDLQIEKVTQGFIEKATSYRLGETIEHLGQALTIDIMPKTEVVTIYYSTSPLASALDWIPSELTSDKKYPFLYSQGQSILTRSWIPCQDSPGVRVTYSADIVVPSHLMAVMSAENPQEKSRDGRYHFEMRQAIPPYLIAIAVGDLKFGAIGEQTGIYAEPNVLESALYEFADMDTMLTTAENLYGPYLWERYDLLVLPASFPFGGMENPRLTFATPTVIAGDRSLTSLVAHELAHSWSGNLVTNATWNDFWLNEGFTVYFERRIMEDLYGTDYTDMLAVLGYQDLEATVKNLGLDHADTHLKLDLKGRDADDAMTDIAYEKGSLFLTFIESKIGRDSFDLFLKNYFEKHKFQTLTTEEFIEYFKLNILNKYKIDVDLNEWIYRPGIPQNIPKITSTQFDIVEKEIEKIISKGIIDKNISASWTTHEWLHYIRHLPDDLDESLMRRIDQQYQFHNSGNAEILAAWFELSIRNGYIQQIEPDLERFLTKVGRRKFLSPLYRSLKENNRLDLALSIYKKARKNYHSVSYNTIDALLGYSTKVEG